MGPLRYIPRSGYYIIIIIIIMDKRGGGEDDYLSTYCHIIHKPPPVAVQQV